MDLTEFCLESWHFVLVYFVFPKPSQGIVEMCKIFAFVTVNTKSWALAFAN